MAGGDPTIHQRKEDGQHASCGVLDPVIVSVVESAIHAHCAVPTRWDGGQQVMPEIKASGEEQPAGGGGIAEAASGMKSLLTASSVDETGA